jgi:Putative peptidoglycan binding domain
MLRVLSEIRGTHWVAILIPIVMCLVVPCANARQQTSSNESATGTSTRSGANPGKSNSTTKKTTSTSTQSMHKRASTSSASTARTSSATHHPTRRSSRKSRTKRVRGQQKIDSERATSIQEALIREHYLSGEPTGVWDQASEDAMRRYQSDQGWQTKEVPDSRALIKLGLGPNNDHLLNPDSAMTSTPIARRTEAPAAPAQVSTTPEHAADPGDAQPSTKPASAPEVTPAAQPTPATPPKDSEDSPKPQ